MSDSIGQHERRIGLLLFASAGLIVLAASLLLATAASSTVVVVVISASAALAIWAFLLHRRLNARLIQYLQRIALASTETARGNLDRPIAADEIPLRELSELAESINAVARRARSDITELKRLERVRSEFLGNVSHELRTPIFAVQGYLETLIDGAMDDPAVRYDFLNKAHHNVLRLHTLLNDLIEISRIESGEMKMIFRYFDAAEHFRTTVEELRPTAEIAGISLNFQVSGGRTDDALVLGDRERLKQVLVNLIENALKYNYPDGTVDVELQLEDTYAMVHVRDSGIGIPDEDLGRIFERFYRVNKDRSRAVGGSGLGLAIVKHILEAHGATIEVTSQLGVGSDFAFRLKR